MTSPVHPQGAFDVPDETPGAEEAAVSYREQGGGGREQGVEAALARNESRLMAIDGVQGVAVGGGGPAGPAIIVYLRDASVARRLPATVEGFRLEPQVVGEIDAFRRR